MTILKKFITPSGSPKRTVYELDKKQMRLVKVRDVDFQAQIQSYFDSVNYKDIIEKTGAKELTQEVILEYFPQKKPFTYGDYSQIEETIFDNIDLANTFFATFDEEVKAFNLKKADDQIVKDEKVEEVKKEEGLENE